MQDVAIVGAGMAGLACADALVAAGRRVTLFDKGRGPGGRMATRRMAAGAGEATFDMGAQYFTVRDPAFAAEVAEWEAAGVAAPWPAGRSDAWVGVPAMNAPIRHLADRHAVHFGTLVKGLERSGAQWSLLTDAPAAARFDAVVLALPAEQTAPLLSLHDLDLARTALYVRSQPCWTAMFAFAGPVACAADSIRDTGPLAWAARNSAKPGREGPECWVAQAGAPWSAAHLEKPAEAVLPLLQAVLAEAVGAALPPILSAAAHRWRYALSAGTGIGSLWNGALRIGACGDWLLGPRVECAWLSGRMLAERMLEAGRRVA